MECNSSISSFLLITYLILFVIHCCVVRSFMFDYNYQCRFQTQLFRALFARELVAIFGIPDDMPNIYVIVFVYTTATLF